MNLEKTLKALREGRVDFVLIGGAAMSLQGSAYVTQDIDICYARSRENIQRLAEALKPFHVKLRGAPEGLPFRFDADTIAKGLNFTLSTDLGDIDFFGEVAGLGDFEKVKTDSEVVPVYGADCWILSIQGLIKTKRTAGRSKDLAVLPELEALSELRKKLGGE